MSEEKTCETCGARIPADAPGGACPACLLGAGLGGDKAPAEPFDREELARLLPQFEIEEFVGQGGMGVVYRARQVALDRVVALKILTRDVAKDPAFAERFTREARALAALNHPNIVGVFEAGRAGDLWFLTMEYVDGVNLRQAERAGRLSSTQALGIVPQVCDALQYAHDQGVVHRDIKPENILLDRKGGVKIADFGLAKLLNPELADHTLTGTQQVMGTLHYIAPEQMRTPQEVDHRADIYSLGVVFYEMLTGDLPIGRFPNPSEKVEVDVRLDEVVLRTLERERERRYQHVSEVKTCVENIAASPDAAPVKADGDVRVAPAESRLSYLAVAGILSWPFGILWALFLMNTGARDEVAIVIPIFGLTGIFLSWLARVSIKRDPQRLHGLGLANLGLMVPLVILVVGLVLSFFAFFLLMRDEADTLETVEAMAMEAHAKDYIARIDGMGGMAPLDEIASMIDPRKRGWFLGLPDDEFQRLCEEQKLGLAMLDRNRVPGRLGDYDIVDRTVKLDEGRAEVFLRQGRNKILFGMVRVNDEWFLDVGEVRLEVHSTHPGGTSAEIAEARTRAATLVERVNALAGITPIEGLLGCVNPRRRGWVTDLAPDDFQSHFEKQHLGLAFIDKYRLPAPLAAFEIQVVRITARSATVTMTWQASRIEFGMVRVADTWFLDVGPVNTHFPGLSGPADREFDWVDGAVMTYPGRCSRADLPKLERYLDPLKRIQLRGLSEAEFNRRQEAGELGLAFRPEGWLPGLSKGFRTAVRPETFQYGRGQVLITTDEADHTVRFPVVRVEGKWFLGVGPIEKLPNPNADLKSVEKQVAKLLDELPEESDRDVLDRVASLLSPRHLEFVKSLTKEQFEEQREKGNLGLAFRPAGILPGVAMGYSLKLEPEDVEEGRGHATVWTEESALRVRFPVQRHLGNWVLVVGKIEWTDKPEGE